MESRLPIPKPSGSKRPAPANIPKSILPSDGIKLNNQQLNSRSQFDKNFPPPAKVIRFGSPDHLRKDNFTNRSKLRRSRSACDLRETKTFTKILTTIQDEGDIKMNNLSNYNNRSKLRRSQSACDVNSLAKKNSTNYLKRNLTIIKNSKITKTIVAPKIVQKAEPIQLNRYKSANIASKKIIVKPNQSQISLNEKPSTNNKPYTISLNKKIPAYDYKARFNDLLERHKVAVDRLNSYAEQLTHLNDLPEKYEQAKQKAIHFEENYTKELNEKCKLAKRVDSLDLKLSSLTENLLNAKERLQKLIDENDNLIQQNNVYNRENVTLNESNKKLVNENQFLHLEAEASKEQLFNYNTERKQLHNTIMDLKGNIRVFCRVRPPLDKEDDRALCDWNYLDENSLEITNGEYLTSGKNKIANHQFSFDHVFHPGSTQTDVFDLVAPLIQSALDGFNICIFAYGQTGSGKTFTMDGSTENIGIIPRTVDLLFEAVRNYKRLGWEYSIKATFLEIYNEILYDLLSNEHKDMDIRMAKNKTDIYVSNITEKYVSSASHLRELIRTAKMNRTTAATIANERSSRSHAVTQLEIIGKHEGKNETVIGTINLVDLAGSESPKTSIRMNETKNINRSLSELTNVILALLQKSDHIPYRNSKLTHLLMPSLGGNSKTVMFINVSPFQDCFVETVKCLRFAASVNSCKMTKAKKNKVLTTA